MSNTNPNGNPKMMIRLGETLHRAIIMRGGAQKAGRESLDRYFAMLARYKDGMRGIFTATEADLILESVAGIKWEARMVVRVDQDILDGILLCDLIRKYGENDIASVKGWLKLASVAEKFVLVDAIEQQRAGFPDIWKDLIRNED
jgi:hypothetical protein